MVKRIIWIVVALVVTGVFYLGYKTYDAGRSLSNGEVRTEDSRSTGSTTSAKSTPYTPPSNQTIVYPAANEPGGSGAVTTPSPTTSGEPPPPGDTLGPNPPDGQRFAGSGKYQLYRQGNITYRLDTESGQSCIIYATDDEWTKARIRKNACPRK